MSPNERPTKAQRREEARQAALALRAEQERRAKRNRLMAIIGASVLVLGFLGLAAWIVFQPEETGEQPSFAADNGGGVVMDADGVVTPPADADDDWPVGAFGDAVVVTVYSDAICPWCARFEALAGPVLDEMRLAGEVVVDHRIVGNLDGFSMDTRYSTRAANALYTVAELAPESFLDFQAALFANQPAENTPGLSDEQIADLARAVGVPEEAVEAIGAGTYEWWVGKVTNAARDLYNGRLGTPAIRLNGEPLDDQVNWQDEAALRAAIEAARG